MGTSKIGNKKVKKLLQSNMAKTLLNKRLNKTYSKLSWSLKDLKLVTQIQSIFFKNNGRNLSENFVGIFPADKKRESLDKVSGKETKYSFFVPNTDQARKLKIYWWSFLDIDEKGTLYLFDSLGIYDLLNLIVNNDLDVFKCVIPGQIKQIVKKDNKVTLLK